MDIFVRPDEESQIDPKSKQYDKANTIEPQSNNGHSGRSHDMSPKATRRGNQ